MTKVVADWCTMTGVVKSSYSDSMSIDVVAFSVYGVKYVNFLVTDSLGRTSNQLVGAPSLRVPTDTTADSKFVDRYNGPASFMGYGITLSMSDYPDGPITIAATVVPHRGVEEVLSPIIVYNNIRGELDIPAVVPTVYVSATGSDGNTGLTIGSPLLSIAHAAEIVMGGLGDAGGGNIILLNGTHEWAGNIAHTEVSTSGDFWLSIIGESKAAILTRQSDTESTWLKAVNGTRIRLSNLTLTDKYIGLYNATSGCHLWADDCVITTSLATASTALFGLAPNGIGGSNARLYCTGSNATYVSTCFDGYSFIRDCSGDNYLCKLVNQTQPTLTAVNLYAETQELAVSDYHAAITVTSVDTTDEGSSVVRYTTNAGSDFGTPWGLLVGSGLYVTVSGGLTGGVLGTYPIVDGGGPTNPWIELQLSGIVSEESSTGNVTFTLSYADGSPIDDYAALYHCKSSSTNTLLHSIRGVNLTDCDGVVFNQGTVANIAVVNVADGIASTKRSKFVPDSLHHALVAHNLFSGELELTALIPTTDTVVRNNITYGMAWNGTPAAFQELAKASHNHFILSGDAFGPNASVGDPFADTSWRTTGIYAISPESSAYETAYGLLPVPTYSLALNARNANKGCWTDIAGSYTTLDGADLSVYTKTDGSRAFTGVVSGVDPVLGSHLATKNYVDTCLSNIDGGPA